VFLTRRRLIATLMSGACLPGLRRSGMAAEPGLVRIATLKFGTVAWEMDVIKHHRLDLKHGIRVELIDLAGKRAADLMLMGGEADVITTDWLWVSRQRSAGSDFTFRPIRGRSVMVGPHRSSLGDLRKNGGRRPIAGRHALQRARSDPARDAPVSPPRPQRAGRRRRCRVELRGSSGSRRGFRPLMRIADAAQRLAIPTCRWSVSPSRQPPRRIARHGLAARRRRPDIMQASAAHALPPSSRQC
jgi:hypothetical protein